MVMDDFPAHKAHEINRQSENMGEVITRTMQAFLSRRQSYRNTQVSGTKGIIGTESTPNFSAQHALDANGAKPGILREARPKVVHNLNCRHSFLLH